MTQASKWIHDPRVKRAFNLLQEALSEHQAGLAGIKAPDCALATAYQDKLHQLTQFKGASPVYPYIGSGLGHGPWVELEDGSVKFDAIGGIGQLLMGHNHPKMMEASLRAAIEDLLMQGHLQQNGVSIACMQKLLELAPTMNHAFLTSSGAMACENALKIAFQAKAPAMRLLAFEHGFMGRTLALAQVTDNAAYREGLPETLKVDYLPFYDHEKPKDSQEVCLRQLKIYLKRYPNQHGALAAELVQGEGGIRPGSPAFFRAIFQCAKQAGLPILVDEVQTFLRTSQPFAYQHFGLEEFVDIVTVGKTAQLCATLYKSAWKPRPGLLSQTYTSSTSALYGFLAVVHEMQRSKAFGHQGHNMQIHAAFVERLEAIERELPGTIQGPYGVGLMVAFTPLDGSEATTKYFSNVLYQEGAIGFMAGHNPWRARLLLPGPCLKLEDLDILSHCIKNALKRTLDWKNENSQNEPFHSRER